jgi:hypothetical protein
VIENRAHEVGIALFDREDGGGGALVLEQHVEGGASYGATLCELASSRPGVVLVVGGAGGGDGGMGVNRAVRRFARARDVAIVELSRRLFGARDAGKVLKKRRPQRERGRMGTSVRWDAPDLNVQTISFDCPGNTLPSTSAR